MLPEGNIIVRLIILKPVARDGNYFTSSGGVMIFFFFFLLIRSVNLLYFATISILYNQYNLSIPPVEKTAGETSNRWKGNG